MNSKRGIVRNLVSNFFYSRPYTHYFRVYHAIEKEMIYDNILEKLEESTWTTPEYINKGFALLAIDKFKYNYAAKEAFENAMKLDVNSEYRAEVECGLEQASEEVREIKQIAFNKM
jgi:hypothetical protein